MLREGLPVGSDTSENESIVQPALSTRGGLSPFCRCGRVTRKKRTNVAGVCGDGESAQVVKRMVEGLGRRAVNYR